MESSTWESETINVVLVLLIEERTSNSSASTSDAIVCSPPPGVAQGETPPQLNLNSPITMYFLVGLARTQRVCERSLASCSSRIALPVVAKTVPAPVTLRRNGTQTPNQSWADTPLWKGITGVMHRVQPISRQRDTTPDQAWERRSAMKNPKRQEAELPGPSTGKLTRSIACIFNLLPIFMFTLPFSSRSYCLC